MLGIITSGFTGNVVGNLVASGIGFLAGRAQGGAATGGTGASPYRRPAIPGIGVIRATEPVALTRSLRMRRDLIAAQYRRRR